MNYQNYQNSMILTSSDSKRTLRHLFLFTNSTRENWFQYYAEYTQLQLTFLGLHSWTQYFFYTTHFPYLQLMLSFRKLMFLIIQPLLDDYLDVFLWHFGTVKIPRSLAAVSAKGREQVMQRRQSKV